MDYIIGELIEVKINGKWWGAEVLDVGDTGAFVYIFDLRIKKNVASRNMRWAGTR